MHVLLLPLLCQGCRWSDWISTHFTLKWDHWKAKGMVPHCYFWHGCFGPTQRRNPITRKQVTIINPDYIWIKCAFRLWWRITWLHFSLRYFKIILTDALLRHDKRIFIPSFNLYGFLCCSLLGGGPGRRKNKNSVESKWSVQAGAVPPKHPRTSKNCVSVTSMRDVCKTKIKLSCAKTSTWTESRWL